MATQDQFLFRGILLPPLPEAPWLGPEAIVHWSDTYTWGPGFFKFGPSYKHCGCWVCYKPSANDLALGDALPLERKRDLMKVGRQTRHIFTKKHTDNLRKVWLTSDAQVEDFIEALPRFTCKVCMNSYRREDFLKEHADAHGNDIALIRHEREDRVPGATDVTNTKLGTREHQLWTAERKRLGLPVAPPADNPRRQPLSGRRVNKPKPPQVYQPPRHGGYYREMETGGEASKRLPDVGLSQGPSKPGVTDVFGSDSEPLTELESEDEPPNVVSESSAGAATKNRPVNQAASERAALLSRDGAKARAVRKVYRGPPPPFVPILQVAVPPLSATQSRALGLPPSHTSTLFQSQIRPGAPIQHGLFVSSGQPLTVPIIAVDDYAPPSDDMPLELAYPTDSEDDVDAVEDALNNDELSDSDSDASDSENEEDGDPVSAIRSTLAVEDGKKQGRGRRRAFPFGDDSASASDAKRRRIHRPADIDVRKLPSWNELSPPVPARLSPAFWWDKGTPNRRSASVATEASTSSSSSRLSTPFPSLSTVTCGSVEPESSATDDLPKVELRSASPPVRADDNSAALWMTPHAQRIGRSCSPSSAPLRSLTCSPSPSPNMPSMIPSRDSSPLSSVSSEEEKAPVSPVTQVAEAQQAPATAPPDDATSSSQETVKPIKSESGTESSITELLGRFALDLCSVKDLEAKSVMHRFWRNTMESVVKTGKNDDAEVTIVPKELPAIEAAPVSD